MCEVKALMRLMDGSRGSAPPLPVKIHKFIRFLSITGWDGPLIVVFEYSLPLSTKKRTKKHHCHSLNPLTKQSVPTHETAHM